MSMMTPGDGHTDAILQRRKRNRLRKVRMNELSLVDRPACPRSLVVIAKRLVTPASFAEVYNTLNW